MTDWNRPIIKEMDWTQASRSQENTESTCRDPISDFCVTVTGSFTSPLFNNPCPGRATMCFHWRLPWRARQGRNRAESAGASASTAVPQRSMRHCVVCVQCVVGFQSMLSTGCYWIQETASFLYQPRFENRKISEFEQLDPLKILEVSHFKQL